MPMPMLKHMGQGNVRCLKMEDCANAKILGFKCVLIHTRRTGLFIGANGLEYGAMDLCLYSKSGLCYCS